MWKYWSEFFYPNLETKVKNLNVETKITNLNEEFSRFSGVHFSQLAKAYKHADVQSEEAQEKKELTTFRQTDRLQYLRILKHSYQTQNNIKMQPRGTKKIK